MISSLEHVGGLIRPLISTFSMAESNKPTENEKENGINHNPTISASESGNSEENPTIEHDARCCRAADVGDRRKFRSLTFCRRYKSKSKESAKKRKGPWCFKLNCCRVRKNLDTAEIPEANVNCDACVCTGYRRTDEHHLGAGVVFESTPPNERRIIDYPRFTRSSSSDDGKSMMAQVVDVNQLAKDFTAEDCDERARAERAREIEEGIEPPPGYLLTSRELFGASNPQLSYLSSVFHSRLSLNFLPRASLPPIKLVDTLQQVETPFLQRVVHTQVDYIHCLVPDLLAIANCQFYWGKMDRYEAEKLLENRPEGTFLLRDSAQEEYLFSVSFRRYERSLHARIEQWNHRFSFDSHDPAVYSSETVCGLIEHYKDPNSCMFFEPMLTTPLNRTKTFSLQHLCRAAICNNVTYDGINKVHLPKSLKSYLKEYHYKQRVRVRRFDLEQ
uniref:Suppressor of cytokine signaling 5 n=1 Tax=Strigamia maritima TaxID=126957 RepID=T1IPQ6_STRMM